MSDFSTFVNLVLTNERLIHQIIAVIFFSVGMNIILRLWAMRDSLHGRYRIGKKKNFLATLCIIVAFLYLGSQIFAYYRDEGSSILQQMRNPDLSVIANENDLYAE